MSKTLNILFSLRLLTAYLQLRYLRPEFVICLATSNFANNLFYLSLKIFCLFSLIEDPQLKFVPLALLVCEILKEVFDVPHQFIQLLVSGK